MGRRKDPPDLQAAKGYPGRRKSQVVKAIAEATAKVEAEPVPADDPFPLPALFAKASDYWARAAAMWRVLSDVLRATGRRQPGYRGALMRYCMWTQYVEQAADTIRKDCPDGALTIKWTMGHGETKVLPHPSFRIIEAGEPVLRLLEAEFGLTPRGDQYIQRAESFNGAQRDLFDRGKGGRVDDKPEAGGTEGVDPLDLMKSADSAPPGVRPN